MSKLLRKLAFLAVSLLASLAWGQTVTVNVNLKSMFGANQVNQTQVCFSLVDANEQQIPNAQVVGGTGVIVPTSNQCLSPNASGLVSTIMYANDQISPAGTLYSVKYTFQGRVVHGSLYNFLLADGTENLNTKVAINVPPLIATPTGDTTYMRRDGGNSPTTGPWTFNFLGTFNAGLNSTSATITGPATAKNLNTIRYADQFPGATADVQITNAIADLPSTGGTVDARGYGATTQTIAAPVAVGTATKPVTLVLDNATTFSVTYSAGGQVFTIADGSKVLGLGMALGSAKGGFKIAATANFSSLFANSDPTGAQESFTIQGVPVFGASGMTCTSAIFDVQGVFINTVLRDNYTGAISTASGTCRVLRVRPGTGTTKIADDTVFDNNNFDCTGGANCIAVSLENAAASVIQSLTFIGGGIQHSGANQNLLNINGAGLSGGVTNVQFINTHFEASSTVAQTTLVSIADARHISFFNVYFSGLNAATNLFNISQSAANLTGDIDIHNLHTTGPGSVTNIVNDTINSITIPSSVFNNDLQEYHFGSAAGTFNTSVTHRILDNLVYFVPSKAYVAAGDTTAGGIHLAPIASADGQMVAITAAPTFANGVSGAAAGIYFEQSSAFGMKLHLATTDAFGSGAKFRWQINHQGMFLAETDNALDIGASGANRPRNLFLAGNLNLPNLLASTTAPTIAAAGCGGSAASIATNNGTAAFSINVGTAPAATGCTVTLPSANNAWNCTVTDITTNSTSVFLQKQTGGTLTTAILQNFSDVAVATAPTASDIYQVSCFAR